VIGPRPTSILKRLFVFHTLIGILRLPHQRECLDAAGDTPIGDKTTACAIRSTVILTAHRCPEAYPDSLRESVILDIETKKRLTFLTTTFCFSIDIARSSVPLASRMFFPGSKTALRQSVLRNSRERREDSQSGSLSHLCVVAIARKRSWAGEESLPTSQRVSITSLKRCPFTGFEAFDSQSEYSIHFTS